MIDTITAWAISIVGIAIAIFLLDRLGLWMEERGWVYYRRVKPKGGTIGNALLEVESILQPSRQHVLEVRMSEHSEEADSGDPPETGDSK